MPGQTWDSYTVTSPQWCAEYLNADRLFAAGTQVDPAQFSFADAQTITVTAAATAGDPVAISIEALEAAIPAGQVLDFGSGKLFTLAEKANIGATSLTGALAVSLTGNETYAYPGLEARTVVPSGTLVGRTYAERDAGDGFGPADLANDEEIFIVAFANDFVERDAGVTLVRHDVAIYENKLPGFADLNAAGQTKVRELYDCRTLPVNV